MITLWMPRKYAGELRDQVDVLAVACHMGLENEYVMFSGLKYEINISQPAGSRVRGLTLEDGMPMDPDGKYEVATNDYLANSHLLNKGTVFGDGDELPELIESDAVIHPISEADLGA